MREQKHLIIGVYVMLWVSGLVDSIVYGVPFARNLLICLLYSLGVAGLKIMWESRKHEKPNRYLLLFTGFVAILLSWFILENVFGQMFTRW